MRILAALATCFALSACIDADLTLDFSDGETAAMAASFSLSRQLYDMIGQSPEAACPKGESAITQDSFTCAMTETKPIAEVLAEGGTLGSGAEFDPANGLKIERIDENHLRVSFDFANLTKGAGNTSQDMGGMEDMIRAAMAGHSLSFKVAGYKITSTTGTLAEDGKSASRVIPVTQLLDPKPDFGGAFITEVQLRQRCTLWVFCD